MACEIDDRYRRKEMNFSVLILTYNEEQNIAACLESLKECDDIAVLDSFSMDNTVDIARNAGYKVYQRKFDSFADQRNYGLDNIIFKNQWVFHLDADERFTPELIKECSDLAAKDEKSGYFAASKTIFKDRWLRWSGEYPVYQMRFSKIGEIRFIQSGHGQREGEARRGIGKMTNAYLHLVLAKGTDDWNEKHRKYARQEAEAYIRMQTEKPVLSDMLSSDEIKRRRAMKQLSFTLPFRGTLRFIMLYFLKLGFLDGYAGLEYCRLKSKYETMIAEEICNHRNKQGND